MPRFFVWTPEDFGTTSYVFSGTYTMSGTPDVIEMADDDAIFNDGTAERGGGGDTGTPQELTSDTFLDGAQVGSAGDDIQDAAEASVVNNTTGETGYLIYVTIGDDGTGAGFVGYASTIDINPGDSFTISDVIINPVQEDYANLVICFASGTTLRTPSGVETIENLDVGDVLDSLDHGPVQIRWIGRRHLTKEELGANPNLRPIRIKANALGQNIPSRSLIVSPQHRLLVRSKIAVRMFGSREILVAAKHLLALPGIEIAADIQAVTYHHIMCERHEIVTANGTLAETLYTGTQALKALSPKAKEEIKSIFGDAPFLTPKPARPTPKGAQIKTLVSRHIKNEKPIYSVK